MSDKELNGVPGESAAKPESFLGQIVRVDNERFTGYGFAAYDSGPRKRVIGVLLENGNTWEYDADTVRLATPEEITKAPRAIQEKARPLPAAYAQPEKPEVEAGESSAEPPKSLSERLREACNGHPHAKIPWPHRLLHEAADEIERLAAPAAPKPLPTTEEIRAKAKKLAHELGLHHWDMGDDGFGGEWELNKGAAEKNSKTTWFARRQGDGRCDGRSG